ncbi:hypothetical protein C5167_007791 [Papaver somniferum]|nr:hypothetical protein C5167_007791 [Papaver somniferum]
MICGRLKGGYSKRLMELTASSAPIYLSGAVKTYQRTGARSWDM